MKKKIQTFVTYLENSSLFTCGLATKIVETKIKVKQKTKQKK